MQEEFGKFLVDTAQKNVTNYFFDVFHDIHFIMKEYSTNKESTFYWSYRQTGTCINKDYSKFIESCDILGADAQYMIKHTIDYGNRIFEVTKL